jgi:uncharacterized protein
MAATARQGRPIIRVLRRVALLIVLAYAAVLAGLFYMQRSLLYPGGGRQALAAAAGLADFSDVVLETPDGERLVGWWRPPQPGKAVILYFHGNGGSLWNRRNRVADLTRDGRGLLIASYRGYSGSTGSPTEAGLRTDARAAYDFVARDYEASRIVAYGESLGSGVAVRLATERPVAGLILDAPYTSTVDVAARTYWYVPVAWLMQDQYRSIDIIGQVKAPILFMHGTSDRIIPFAFGERLYDAAPEPKRFLRLEGVGHTRILESGGLAAVDAFIRPIEAAYSDKLPEPDEPKSANRP